MCWRDRTGFGLQGPQGQCLGQLGEVGTLQPLVQGPVGPLSWHSRAVKTKQTDFHMLKTTHRSRLSHSSTAVSTIAWSWGWVWSEALGTSSEVREQVGVQTPPHPGQALVPRGSVAPTQLQGLESSSGSRCAWQGHHLCPDTAAPRHDCSTSTRRAPGQREPGVRGRRQATPPTPGWGSCCRKVAACRPQAPEAAPHPLPPPNHQLHLQQPGPEPPATGSTGGGALSGPRRCQRQERKVW